MLGKTFLVNVVAAATSTVLKGEGESLWRFCSEGDFPVVVCNCCKAFFKSFGRSLHGEGFLSCEVLCQDFSS